MSSAPFGDAVAAFYEQYMVPMVFDPYAEDLVARVSARPMGDVLETTAGTGIVTRKLAAVRSDGPRSIVATDLSQAMLDHGRRLCPDPIVEWRQADAMSLPFPDASFDLVVSQFGAMFFPDRSRAYSEARRVLRRGGRFIFNVWDRAEENEFAHSVSAAVRQLFPGNPPTFLERVPHGYFDTELIASDIAKGGFGERPSIETVTKISRAASAAIAAQAFVKGTPLRGQIEERDATLLENAVIAAERALTDRFGNGPIEGRMQAFVIDAKR